MKALLIVDMQNDFMPGGALAVPHADEIVPVINALIHQFPLVVASQDWHPPHHVSFASSHPGKKVGDVVVLDTGEQRLWPVHCVKGTRGADLIPTLDKQHIAAHFHKGSDIEIDSYSAFFDNARLKSTGLADYLKQHHVTEITLVGVATDYCVLYSALDAIDQGFKVVVIKRGCRALNVNPRDEELSFAAMSARGAQIV